MQNTIYIIGLKYMNKPIVTNGGPYPTTTKAICPQMQEIKYPEVNKFMIEREVKRNPI